MEEAVRAKVAADGLLARLEGIDELATLLRPELAERVQSLAAGLYDLAVEVAQDATDAMEAAL